MKPAPRLSMTLLIGMIAFWGLMLACSQEYLDRRTGPQPGLQPIGNGQPQQDSQQQADQKADAQKVSDTQTETEESTSTVASTSTSTSTSDDDDDPQLPTASGDPVKVLERNLVGRWQWLGHDLNGKPTVWNFFEDKKFGFDNSPMPGWSYTVKSKNNFVVHTADGGLYADGTVTSMTPGKQMNFRLKTAGGQTTALPTFKYLGK